MSQQLVWRIWLYRTGRAHERLLKLLSRAGFCGLGSALLLHILLPGFRPGLQLLMLGGALVPVGMGHALLGDPETADEGEELSPAARLLTGMIAASGGVLIVLNALAQVTG